MSPRYKVSGEKRERREWHRVVIFDEYHVGVADKYLERGSKVYLEGQLQTRKYVDSQGEQRYVTEIVLGRFNARLILLDARRPGETAPSGEGPPPLQSIEDDEIPFQRGGEGDAKSGGDRRGRRGVSPRFAERSERSYTP